MTKLKVVNYVFDYLSHPRVSTLEGNIDTLTAGIKSEVEHQHFTAQYSNDHVTNRALVVFNRDNNTKKFPVAPDILRVLSSAFTIKDGELAYNPSSGLDISGVVWGVAVGVYENDYNQHSFDTVDALTLLVKRLTPIEDEDEIYQRLIAAKTALSIGAGLGTEQLRLQNIQSKLEEVSLLYAQNQMNYRDLSLDRVTQKRLRHYRGGYTSW